MHTPDIPNIFCCKTMSIQRADKDGGEINKERNKEMKFLESKNDAFSWEKIK